MVKKVKAVTTLIAFIFCVYAPPFHALAYAGYNENSVCCTTAEETAHNVEPEIGGCCFASIILPESEQVFELPEYITGTVFAESFYRENFFTQIFKPPKM